jgi:hypothetical protein
METHQTSKQRIRARRLAILWVATALVAVGGLVLLGLSAGRPSGWDESNAALEAQLTGSGSPWVGSSCCVAYVKSVVCTNRLRSPAPNTDLRVCDRVFTDVSCQVNSQTYGTESTGEKLVVRVTGDHYSIRSYHPTFWGTCVAEVLP